MAMINIKLIAVVITGSYRGTVTISSPCSVQLFQITLTSEKALSSMK